MRVTTPRSPNTQLRSQRQQRCWTQSQVADKLYALLDETELAAHGVINRNMVSKWEGGLHSPSVFWQGKLCELFATSPEELGLLTRAQAERQGGEQLGILGQEPPLPGACLEPAESDRLVPAQLMVDASTVRMELLDGPAWCAEQITDFKGLIASWQEQRVPCPRLQGLLYIEIERWNIAQQPDEKTGGEFPARRTVLAALVTLPPTLLKKLHVGPLSALLLEEFLAQSATSLTAC